MRVTIEELSQDFPAYLQRVQTGESCTIIVQGKAFTPSGNSEANAEIKPTECPRLSDALAQLRQICEEEDYSLEIAPRIDRAVLAV